MYDWTEEQQAIIAVVRRFVDEEIRPHIDDFEHNGLVRDGVERCLERVCEAIYRLGDKAEALMPGQPWREIRGMGNRLRHG